MATRRFWMKLTNCAGRRPSSACPAAVSASIVGLEQRSRADTNPGPPRVSVWYASAARQQPSRWRAPSFRWGPVRSRRRHRAAAAHPAVVFGHHNDRPRAASRGHRRPAGWSAELSNICGSRRAAAHRGEIHPPSRPRLPRSTANRNRVGASKLMASPTRCRIRRNTPRQTRADSCRSTEMAVDDV